MSITVRGLTKAFGSVRALDGIDLSFESGTLAALLGPSGCGKTTLLRTIAGFETADAGTVQLDGKDVTAAPLAERNVGFVFQNYALFPHLTVAQNVGFALAVRHRPRAEMRERVRELLDLVQLEGYERRHPHELSGGQRQRVALARALAARPAVLLLDEPFAALDLQVRKDLRRWLRALHERTHVTTLLVTHDAEEALDIADRVAILRAGGLQQEGTPRAVFHEPANAFVMGFVGEVNAVREPSQTLYVRPSDFRIEKEAFAQARPGDIVRVLDVGPRTRLELSLGDGQRILADVDPATMVRVAPQAGDTVFVRPLNYRLFAELPA